MLYECFNPNIIRHLQNSEANARDVCTWLGVTCTDGLITEIFLYHKLGSASRRDNWVAEIDWLPPTLRFVHFEAVRVPGVWKPDRLPRELRYLCLKFVYDAHMQSMGKCNYHTDFRRLPPRMEELISVCSAIGQIIDLRSLPDTMRLIFIKQWKGNIQKVYIDYATLPDALRYLNVDEAIGTSSKTYKVVQAGVPTNVHLETKVVPGMPDKFSLYVRENVLNERREAVSNVTAGE